MAAASITTAGTGVVAPEVKVITAENTEVVVPHSLVRMSQTLSTLVGDDFTLEAIPLFDVPHSILNMIIEYCNHYENTPVPEIAMPIVTNNIRDIIPDWDANLIDVDQKTLNLLLASADYLGVEPLTKLVYAKIATMIKGKGVNEIRSMFGIKNDFSAAEEATVSAESKWVEKCV